MTTTDVSPELVAAVVDALRTGKPVPSAPGIVRLHNLADLADTVRRLRGEHSQESIAARARISQGTISLIETGRHSTVDTLIAVARALGHDLALIPREDA